MASLLDELRSRSAVDCDTLDVEVAKKLGPFVDCTSNQAIAFAELSKADADGQLLYEQLILDSIQLAHWMLGKQSDATLEELAVELMMVELSIQFAPYLQGYLHVQTNPKWSYSTQKTVRNAERIVSHFGYLAPDLDTKRVCVKIPATWEGLQACRALEEKGIATLATTLFCMEQAVLAADAGCTYIAPYVNELRVHFDASYVDPAKAFSLCATAQRYYEKHASKTRVLPASLTSIGEVMQLAGAHHITVWPALLAELATTPVEAFAEREEIGKAFRQTAATAQNETSAEEVEVEVENEGEAARWAAIVQDESLWRLAFTRSGGGVSEGKIIQAINIFADMQESLERMVRKMDVN